jgi:hypothetical protein
MREPMLTVRPEPNMAQGSQVTCVQAQAREFERVGIHGSRTKAGKRLEFQR